MLKTESLSPQDQLVINPAVSIIRGSDDEIMSRFGSRSRSSYRITDTNGHGVLADFVRAFVRPAIPAEVAAHFGINDDTRQEFIEKLTEGSLLISPEQVRYSQLISGMHITPERDDQVLTVVGTGRMAESVAGNLTDLTSSEIEISHDAERAFDESDFVVVCADRLDQAFFYDADEYARISETPWHLSYLDGAEIVVGPTFIPGSTTNYFDRDTLDESARTLRFEHQYMALASPDIEADAPIPLFIAQMAAGWTTAAVAQHLWGPGSFLEDHVLRIDLERMQVIRDRVLRLARNPVTVGSRPDLRHPFI